MDGTEAARRILEIRDIPIVFLTSHAERDMVEKVRDITRYGYVIKNSGDFVLLSSIEMAFELFEAHRNMKENAERFRGVFETSPVGIAIVDTTDQRILQTNPSFRDLVGYSAGELTDMTVRDVTHPDDWEHEVKIIHRRLDQSADEYDFEKRYIRKNGDVRNVRVREAYSICGRGTTARNRQCDRRDRTQKHGEDLRRRETLRKDIRHTSGRVVVRRQGREALRGNPPVCGYGEPSPVPPLSTGVQGARLPSREEIAPDDWALAHTIREGMTITDELLEIDAFDGTKKSY